MEKHAHNFIDITGTKYNRLTVISYAFRKNKQSHWLCKCICGEERIVEKKSLTEGTTKSCGCLKKDNMIKNRRNNFMKGKENPSFKHGLVGTRFYKNYGKMKDRCNNPKDKNYKNYGNRGIKVLWKSFEEFKNDMYESYQKHLSLHGKINTTIERIDNNGDYCKENCKWATRLEQANNKRR